MTRYEQRKRNGICHLCGDKAEYNKSYCRPCSVQRADLARAERRTRVRICKGCGKDFYGLKLRLCRECSDPKSERFRKYQREWRQSLKREVFEAYGGATCACCEESEFVFLSVDHVENNGANHRRELNPKYGTGGARFYGWLKRSNFPSGFQVLCMNCQWGKKLNGGICPHKENHGR